MAAPSGTTWGSTVSSGNSSARIGIYLRTSSTTTKFTASVQVWFWSRWGVDEHWGENTFRADWASSATTSRGGRSFRTTVSTGQGWSTSNQVQIASYSKTYTRTSSAQTGRFAASLSAIEAVGASNTMRASISFTVPAVSTYTVSYSANGGSGAPARQTKQHGVTLRLSSTRPVRDGFEFIGWGTSSTDTTPNYQPGGNYTANASITLYAIWEPEDATVYCYIKYNANGGSNEPTYTRVEQGTATNISSEIPTRIRHTFLGWSTNKSATSATYDAGQSVTLNSSLYLYAVWRLDDPTIKLYDDGRLELVDFTETNDLQISEGTIESSEIVEGETISIGSTINVVELIEI